MESETKREDLIRMIIFIISVLLITYIAVYR